MDEPPRWHRRTVGVLLEIVLPLQNVASGVIAEILRRQPPSAARTTFAWGLAVGPALARVTSVTLSNGVLSVRARDPRWAAEIARARDTVLPRLQQLLGKDAVTDISILREV
jgi:predicted nucleic acid-binding Zn ribbon protein